ncbi:hypothetical protein AAFF_G00312390 [Aldrovandia affinis]|uniref:FERM domain-containing protein n=1 Tax=Aldrovandia affinis TaxID=143900 RepID=A0AAD7SPK1_9TELE|nr:hypothetical protein AAFF_G00312390 [Aldrovandia affinis]
MGDSRGRLQIFKSQQRRASVREVSKESRLQVRVIFLDDSEHIFQVEPKILGSDFYNRVCGYLKLLEKEYFGLEFRHHSGSYADPHSYKGHSSRVWKCGARHHAIIGQD